MTELYRRYVLTALAAAMVLLAVFFLLRGHNLPGGGFVGGLMAAAAVELTIVSQGARHIQARIGGLLLPAAGAGLLLAAASIAAGYLAAGTAFAHVWFHVPVLNLDIGTPLTFDLGVFLVVMASTSLFVLDLTLADSPEDLEALDEQEAVQEAESERRHAGMGS